MKIANTFRESLCRGMADALGKGEDGGWRMEDGGELRSRRARSDAPYHRGNAGFTMVEIALCLAVIAFALVAIIGVLPIGMGVQKSNREETIVNFDAKYLMEAIKGGALGQDDLTNYIVSITNRFQGYQIIANGNGFRTNPLPNVAGVNWYNSFTNKNLEYYALGGATFKTPILTNSANIIGLLTIPKYTLLARALPPSSGFISNFITADFRAITGAAMDQGTSSASKDLAFTYRLFPEVMPFSIPDMTMMNPSLAANMQASLYEVRLRYRWPVLPGGVLGNGTQTYRSAVSGVSLLTNYPGNPVQFYLMRSQTYTFNGITNSLLP
jgi:type II secretory pathway pseudopilin PulG